MAGPIAIAVVAEVAKARAGLASVEGDLSGLGGKASKFGAVLKAGFLAAGAGAAALAVASVKAASDSQQSLGATETVFGKFADTVISTSKEAAQAYGLSANEYRENANLLGSLFKNQGVAMSDLGGKTETMIGQAADLAATFGGTTKDAVEALGSAFKGEFDPLEKYGISIKQSTINAELAARGQDKLTGAALKQAQQIATTDLIMKQAAATQGAFGRESETLAGQQQRLGAQWENIKATIGSALLPILTQLAMTFNEVVLPAITTAWTFLQEKLGPVFATVKGYVDQVTASFGGGKGGGLAGAVATVQEIFGKVVAVVGPIVQSLVNLVRKNWDAILSWTRDVWGQIRSTVKTYLEYVRTVIETVLRIIKALWDRFGDDILRIIKVVFETVGAVIKAALNIIQGVIRTVTAAIKGDWSGVWAGVKQVLSGAWDAIVAIVKGAGKILWTVAKAAFNLLLDAAKAGISKAVSAVAALPGKIKSGLGAVGSLLFSAGQDLIRGLINGVKNMAGSLVSAAKDVVGGAIKGAKSLLGIASPSKVFAEIGKFVGQGFIQGVVGTRAEVAATMSDLAALIADANRDALDQALADARPRLRELAAEYDALRTRLDTLRESFRDYSTAVRDSVQATGDVTGFEADGATSFDGIVAGLRDAKNQAREWKNVLAELDRLGLNKAALDQIASKGPEQGLDAALAIAEEGRKGVREINRLQGQIADLARKAGQTAADALFKEGNKVGSAIIKGLSDGIDKIETRMEGVAERLAARIRAAMDLQAPTPANPRRGNDDLADEMRKTRQAVEKLPRAYRMNERTA